MPVKSVPSMGWNKRSAAVSVLLVLDEQRKRAGQKVVVLREGRGWSQEDLAHDAKVSVKTISRFENGKHEGRRSTVKRIAEALGTSEEELIGPPPAPLGLGAVDPQQEQLEQRLEAIEQALANRLDHERKIDDMLKEQTAILKEIRRVMNGLPDDEALRLFNEGARQIAAAAEAYEATPGASSAGQAGTRRRAR